LNSSNSSDVGKADREEKGKLLVLGGSGFVGQMVCQRAVTEGYTVTSLSRSGLPPGIDPSLASHGGKVTYRKGNACDKLVLQKLFQEEDEDYKGLIHCIGLLFDTPSGLGKYNPYMSGSKSSPDCGTSGTYDSITRITAYNAMDAYMERILQKDLAEQGPFPFAFVSAAEAGWPQMMGGPFIEQNLVPDFLKRYLQAKRAVEDRMLLSNSDSILRPVILRPSVIYDTKQPLKVLPAIPGIVGNTLGVPFMDRPVDIRVLSNAIVNSIDQTEIQGILRYPEIMELQ